MDGGVCMDVPRGGKVDGKCDDMRGGGDFVCMPGSFLLRKV